MAALAPGRGINTSWRTDRFGGAAVKLQFLGSGDAFGSGGRFNTCFHVATADGAFLIDCGASSLIAMRRYGVEPNGVHTIFISHLHGDHFGGVPFFILDAQFYSRRAAPLTVVGPPGLEDRLRQAMEVFFPGSSAAQRRFTVETRQIEAGRTSVINGVAVTPQLVEHACGAPPYGLRFTCNGKVLAYSGDTEWTDALIPLANGADLFIVEALVFDRKIRYHMDYSSLRSNLGRIGAKRVILTHLGPDMLDRAADAFEEVADDGMIVEV
jgi:ribonuclease BN (tRNA processing enzyme)